MAKNQSSSAVAEKPETNNEVKLTKADEGQLRKFQKLVDAGLMKQNELDNMRKALQLANQQLASEGGRGREFTPKFSVTSAKVFIAKMLEKKSNQEIKNELGIEVATISTHIREVSFKLMYLLLEANDVTADTLKPLIDKYGVAPDKIRKPKDKKIEASKNGAADDDEDDDEGDDDDDDDDDED